MITYREWRNADSVWQVCYNYATIGRVDAEERKKWWPDSPSRCFTSERDAETYLLERQLERLNDHR